MSLVRPRKNARHAKPAKAAPGLVAAGLTASFAVADVGAFAGSAAAATANDFARLRQCESGGDYAINTGNGFSGAYQFDRRTWQGLGLPGLAYQASPASQDQAARRLQSERGWGPWPACSRMLGLGGDAVVARSAVEPTRVAGPRASRSRLPAAATRVWVAAAPTAPPAFPGRPITVADVDRHRSDVADWQRRMSLRGWRITVDGYFGPQSSWVARAFSAQKHLHLTVLPGEIDRGVWDAAWLLPVT